MSDKRLILGSYVNDEIIGYLLAYEKNNSFYCWITAVDKRYRRRGILTEMMNHFIEHAKRLGYKKVTLKTLNNKREMLSYIVKNNWNFTDIIKSKNVCLNELRAEKEIMQKNNDTFNDLVVIIYTVGAEKDLYIEYFSN